MLRLELTPHRRNVTRRNRKPYIAAMVAQILSTYPTDNVPLFKQTKNTAAPKRYTLYNMQMTFRTPRQNNNLKLIILS